MSLHMIKQLKSAGKQELQVPILTQIMFSLCINNMLTKCQKQYPVAN